MVLLPSLLHSASSSLTQRSAAQQRINFLRSSIADRQAELTVHTSGVGAMQTCGSMVVSCATRLNPLSIPYTYRRTSRTSASLCSSRVLLFASRISRPRELSLCSLVNDGPERGCEGSVPLVWGGVQSMVGAPSVYTCRRHEPPWHCSAWNRRWWDQKCRTRTLAKCAPGADDRQDGGSAPSMCGRVRGRQFTWTFGAVRSGDYLSYSRPDIREMMQVHCFQRDSPAERTKLRKRA